MDIVRRDVENRRLQDEVVKLKHQIDTVVMTRMSEGTALMQNNAYRTENARLLKMLAQTGEFKEFADFALSSQGGSVRYMNANDSSSKSENNSSANNQDIKPEIEKEDWIPEEAYKAAHDFRNKCASTVSKAMINTLLADLNKIWRAREQKQLSRLKSHTNREVEQLRRAVA